MAVGTYAYVKQTATTIAILDRDTAATVGTISPGLAGLGGSIVLSPDGRYMAVWYTTGGTAVIIDLSTNAVVLTVTLAAVSGCQVVAGWFLFTSNSSNGMWVNTSTMTSTAVTFSVYVDTGVHLANGNAYYVPTSTGTGVIYQVPYGGTASTTFVSGLVTMGAGGFAHDGTYLYYMGYHSATTSSYLYAFTWAAAITGPVTFGGSCGPITRVTSTGHLVCSGSTSGQSLILFTTPPMGSLAWASSTIIAASIQSFTPHPTLGLIYCSDGTNIYEFTISTLTKTSIALSSGSWYLGLTPSGAHLWIGNPSVYVLETTSPLTYVATYTPTVGSGVLAISGALISAPSAPTLTAPANASYNDVSAGLTFTGTYNSTDGYAQNAYALRIKVSGGSYQYWNAGTNALQSSIVWNTGAVALGASWSITLPNTAISNGNIYNWSMASQESGANLQGAFASDFTFTAQAPPSVTVTAPSGTVGGTTSPAIVWTDSLPSGATQIDYQIWVESGAYGTSPGAGTSVWNSGVVASASTSVVVGVVCPLHIPLRVFVQITESGGPVSAMGGSSTYTTFTLIATTPAQPTISAVPFTDPVTRLPEVKITVSANDNQLTANQASLEAGATTGWSVNANSSIAASTVWAQDGAYSLEITATGAGAAGANTPGGTSGVACSPGEVVRAMASFHSPATVRACTVNIAFYNAAGTLISSVTSTPVNSTLTGNGGQAFISATAPALTATMALTISASSLGAGEKFYADCIFLGPGTTTTWTAGGFVGTTTFTVQRSDGAYVRSAGWPAGVSLAIPTATQIVTLYDVEAPPGTTYTYTAAVTGTSGGLTLTGLASAASATVTLSTSGYWWIYDPTNPEGVCVRFVMKSNWQPIVLESGASFKPLGNPLMVKSTDGTKGVGGIIPIYTGDSLASSQAAEQLVQQVQPLCFMTPTRGIYYVMSDPATGHRGTVTPWWEVDQPQSEWQFNVIQTVRP